MGETKRRRSRGKKIWHIDVTRRSKELKFPRAEWKTEPWNQLPAGEFEELTHFTPAQLVDICDNHLTKVPEVIVASGKGNNASKKLAFTIYCAKNAGSGVARSWKDVARALAMDSSYCSRIYSMFAYVFAHDEYGYGILGTNIDIVRVQENLGPMAAATERLGCSVKPLVCLVDGSEEKCCRPHRKFGNDLQQSFYQGRTKAHGETKHDMLFMDGICVTYVGSCSQHDTTLLAKSGHMEALEILRLNGGPVICYGDQAYNQNLWDDSELLRAYAVVKSGFLGRHRGKEYTNANSDVSERLQALEYYYWLTSLWVSKTLIYYSSFLRCPIVVWGALRPVCVSVLVLACWSTS